MKTQFVSNSTRASLIRFGAAVLLFLNVAQASANPGKGDDPYVSITYIGLVEDRARFQFDMVNDNEEPYLLQIHEQGGAILYKEKIDKKTFTKKFELQKEEMETRKLIFTITGLKTKKSQSFEVNTQVRTVQDVVVSKL